MQTHRIKRSAAESTNTREYIVSLELAKRTYERAVLEQIADLVDSEQNLATAGIYMIVDRACRACQSALETISESGSSYNISIASFRDDPIILESWLSSLDLHLNVVHVPLDSTFLAKMPRTVTPVFLEFQNGEPAGLHIGQPKDQWLSVNRDGQMHLNKENNSQRR